LQAGDTRLQAVVAGHQVAAATPELIPGHGEQQGADRAVKEGHAQAFFELPDPLAGGRLGDAVPDGGLGEAAASGDIAE
jgi:hypothetical protein